MDSHETTKRVAIIGGGLAGMAAAHHLIELANERGQSIDVTIFEASSRLGGIVGTERIGGYLVDVGADSFLTNKPGAVNLCRRLGIEDRLVPTDPRFRGAFVLREGRPVAVPDGFQLLSPTALWPVMTSPLFSAWGKLRLLSEWFIPPKSTRSMQEELIDESLADFVRRRFGREALERLIQPLVGGIYTADPERLSLAATMPRFLEMERDFGGLIRASIGKRSRMATADAQSKTSKETKDVSSGARYGLFAGMAGGMEGLIAALRSRVESNCRLKLDCPVLSIESCLLTTEDSCGEVAPPAYEILLADGSREHYSAVIVATAATRTAAIIKDMDFALSSELRGIEFASSALVVTGHALADVRHPMNSFGLVVPHVEQRQILAVSFSSRKFPDRAPNGRILLRTFVGGALQPELLEQNDSQLIETVRSELGDIFGVRGEPDFARVYRYERAMPQYHVGHLDRVSRIETHVRRHPGLALAGNAYRGVGIPDVIASGEQAAKLVFNSATLAFPRPH